MWCPDAPKIINDRTGNKAIVITSPFIYEYWHIWISDVTPADAVLPPLPCRAIRASSWLAARCALDDQILQDEKNLTAT